MTQEQIESATSQEDEAVAQPELEDVQEAQESPKFKSPQESFGEIRKAKQELERKLREQQEVIQRLQQPKVSEDDEIDRLADDDIITKGHARKLAEKMARQIASQVIRERENATVDERLLNKFSDFRQVVSDENFELFRQNEPELAMSILGMKDEPYAQGVAAYKVMKKMGYAPVAQNPDKEKAVKNSQKPLSVNAVTKQGSPLGNAHMFENGLTSELKKSLWKEMQDAAKYA